MTDLPFHTNWNWCNSIQSSCITFSFQQASATPLQDEIADVTAAILLSRFNGRSLTDICAMGGISVDDFSNSVAYKEIFGRGLEEGREKGRLEGRQAQAAALTQLWLTRRLGPLAPERQRCLQGLPLRDLEALADALLDFQSPADLAAWLAKQAS